MITKKTSPPDRRGSFFGGRFALRQSPIGKPICSAISIQRWGIFAGYVGDI